MALHELRDHARAGGALASVRRTALSLDAHYAPLTDLVGDARFALIGEASHGTHDFYHERAELTKRLIIGDRLSAVVCEADWPDAHRSTATCAAFPTTGTAVDPVEIPRAILDRVHDDARGRAETLSTSASLVDLALPRQRFAVACDGGDDPVRRDLAQASVVRVGDV
jgi:hypothetical protein